MLSSSIHLNSLTFLESYFLCLCDPPKLLDCLTFHRSVHALPNAMFCGCALFNT